MIVLLFPLHKAEKPKLKLVVKSDVLAPIIELQILYAISFCPPFLFEMTVFKQPPLDVKILFEIKVLHSVVSKVNTDDAVIPRLLEQPNAILCEFTAAPVIVESHLQNTSLVLQSQTSTLEIEFELLAVAILSFGT